MSYNLYLKTKTITYQDSNDIMNNYKLSLSIFKKLQNIGLSLLNFQRQLINIIKNILQGLFSENQNHLFDEPESFVSGVTLHVDSYYDSLCFKWR